MEPTVTAERHDAEVPTSEPPHLRAVDEPAGAIGLADIIGEAALLLGAGSTVLYQLADKPTGLGVAEHSTTLARPTDRLRTTLLYVYIATLGTDEERQAIHRMVNKAHAPVRSAGRYSAFDPELQLWVAATLAHNGLFIHQRIFGDVDQASRERIYRDSQIFGNLLQVKPEQWPATLAEFEDYWADKLTKLEADPAVQVYVQRLLAIENRPTLLKPFGAIQGLMGRGNIEPEVREILGLTWTPSDQRLYDLFWTVFPPLYRLIPRTLRQLPAAVIVRDTRRRMRAHQRVI